MQEVKNAKSYLKNVIYLEDSSVELFGIQIYGTPWLVAVKFYLRVSDDASADDGGLVVWDTALTLLTLWFKTNRCKNQV